MAESNQVENKAQEQIVPKFERASLLKMMRFAFGRKDTVVAELLQNGRRAGATRIDLSYDQAAKRLTVKDDGCGLSDLSKLIEFCESGWGQEVQANEQPFGVGFLSAFYQGDTVTFASCGKQVRFETRKLLEGSEHEAVFVPEASDVVVGAEVTLDGFEWAHAADRARQMVEGFSIPVTFNGVELDRPKADGERFEDFGVGRIIFGSEIPEAPGDWSMTVYLQGFEVQRSRYTSPVVVHLDSTRFVGKFPDRDRVVDHEAMLKACVEAAKECVKDKLLKAKAEKAPLDFLEQHYDQAKSAGMLWVFNDIDVLPASWFAALDDLPCEDRDELSSSLVAWKGHGKCVQRQEVQTKAVVVAALDGFCAGDYENVNRWNLAYAANAAILTKHLDGDHWIYKEAALVGEDDVAVEVEGGDPDSRQHLDGRFVSCWVAKCKGIHYRSDRLAATLDEMALVEGDVFVPEDASTNCCVLEQESSYRDEFEHFDDSARDADGDALRDVVACVLESDPVKRLIKKVTQALSDVSAGGVSAELRIKACAGGRLSVELAG